MCGTCGCGSGENGVSIQNPREVKAHEHHHHDDGQSHSHDHSHEHHHHDHDHSHGQDHHHKTVIDLEQDILQNNEVMAARNKGYFEAKNIFALNLVILRVIVIALKNLYKIKISTKMTISHFF